jgi:hypothetical protein
MKRIVVVFAVLALASASLATANPLESVLAAPQAKVMKGDFSLRARVVLDKGTSRPAWRCRLYFDTDLNSFTGWLQSRGYEYVACPDIDAGTQLAVARTMISTSDGMGGALCGYGSMLMGSRELTLTVPLSMLGPSDGRFAWELMVFDENGTWLGSYCGRFVQ